MKQEMFCLEYIKTGNASEAYRRAYNCSKMAENSINTNASQLLADTKIRLRIEELKKPIMQKAQLTFESIVEEFIKVKELSLTPDVEGKLNLNSANKSLTELAKLLDFYPKQKLDITSKDEKINNQFIIEVINSIPENED